LARALTRLAGDQGKGGGPAAPISLQLIQKQLPGMIGPSRESVNKQLHVWAQEGLLEIAKGRIIIRDTKL
jgi:CRP-like cAMP-binding protein